MSSISIPGLAPPTKSSRLKALLVQCHDDVDRFGSVILGEKPFDPAVSSSPYWAKQTELGRLIVRHQTVVAPWGNSLGKSHFLGRVCLWWLATRHNSLVVTTAPSHQQLSNVLWKNIRAAAASSAYPLGLHITKSPLSASLGPEHQAIGISTNKVERFSGFHSGQMMLMADEASGIDPAIWEAIDSLNAHKNVLIGNPIRHDGRFKDMFDQALEQARDGTIPQAERTVSLRVASTDSPDIGKTSSDRGLASGGWLRRMYRQYGEHSLWVRSHIRAEFPEQATDTLIPPEWLDWAARPELVAVRQSYPGGQCRIGCDLGEGVQRDNSVVLVRDDLSIREVWSGNTTDLAGTATIYARLCNQYRVQPGYRTYDINGVGKNFANYLARHGVTAIGYQGNGSGGPHYTNLRTACAWALRQRLDPGHMRDPANSLVAQPPFHIPPQAWWVSLREELATLRYDQVGTKNRLLLKEAHKAILGRSPDFMDALLQTFMTGIAQV